MSVECNHRVSASDNESQDVGILARPSLLSQFPFLTQQNDVVQATRTTPRMGIDLAVFPTPNSDKRLNQTLGFPHPEHFSPTNGASATGGRSLVLQDDLVRVLDLNLPSALHAVRLSHPPIPPFNIVFCPTSSRISGWGHCANSRRVSSVMSSYMLPQPIEMVYCCAFGQGESFQHFPCFHQFLVMDKSKNVNPSCFPWRSHYQHINKESSIPQ